MSEPKDMRGIKVTVRDLQTGEEETRVVWNDYMLVTAGSCYVSHAQAHPGTGTHQLTIKGVGGKRAKP